MNNIKLPKDWQIKTLGEVCDEIFAGGDVPKNNFSKIKTEQFQIPIFANGEKNLGLYGYTNIIRVNYPALTISGRGTIGFSVLRLKPFFPIVRLLVLKPNLKTDIKYLKYSIDNSNIKHTGSSIPQLTIPTVKNIKIPIPSLETQQAIVSKIEELFSELDKGIEDLKTAQQQLKTYRQAVLKYAFEGKLTNEKVKEGILPKGWKIVKMTDVIKLSILKHKPQKDEDLFYIGLEHIEKHTGKLKSTVGIEKIKTVKNKFLKGDLLYGKLRPNLNKVYLSKEEGVCSTDILVLKLAENCLGKYLHQIMLSTTFVNEMAENTSGVNLPRVSTKFIMNYEIPLPPVEEQNLIILEMESRLSLADKMEESIALSLQQAEALRQSILKKAFSGELM